MTKRKFYDPIYDVVTFRRKLYTENAVPADVIHQIIETYEFNRLNFLKQEGLAWLEFPSAAHTRFSAALGCWFLGDFAVDNVRVIGPKKLQKMLGQRLVDLEWLDEFRLALLLHDVGHFPFTTTIENNDLLTQRYFSQEETKGIYLRHEDMAVSLIRGESDDNPVFELYKRFLERKFGAALGKSDRYVSDILKELPSVDMEKLLFLLDYRRPEPEGLAEDEQGFMSVVRHLVDGVINIGLLDRCNRLSFFVSGPTGVLPIRSLLHEMALVENKWIRLFDDGVGHVFQVIYTMNHIITKNVLHNRQSLAFEVMLNHAINREWKHRKKGSDFRLYLPFMEDDELFRYLLGSEDGTVRETVHRIRRKHPFDCAGRYCFNEEGYDVLSQRALEALRDAGKDTRLLRIVRRQTVTDHLHQKLKDEGFQDIENRCFIRFTRGFGRPSKEEFKRLNSTRTPRSLWMDLEELSVLEDGRPKKLTEAHAKDNNEFFQLMRENERREKCSFWIFVKDDDDKLCEKAKEVALDLTCRGDELCRLED